MVFTIKDLLVPEMKIRKYTFYFPMFGFLFNLGKKVKLVWCSPDGFMSYQISYEAMEIWSRYKEGKQKKKKIILRYMG